jgi:hypothetical protein
MTTFTSAPIGSTGQSLHGTSVSTSAGPILFLEIVVLFLEIVGIGDPSDGGAIAPVSSTTGLTVNVASTVAQAVNVSVVANSITSSIPFWVSQSSAPWSVSGTVSTQVVSSIPFYVAQSSGPWSVAGTTNVQGTSSVNVLGTVSSQVISSIPFIVSQSSGPWSVAGTTNVQGTSSVNVLGNVTVQGTSSVNVLSTASTQVISSLPFWVSQSSAPWTIGGGINVTAAAFAATVGAAPPAQVLAMGMETVVGSLPVTTAADLMQDMICDSAGRLIVMMYSSRELQGDQRTAMSSVAATTETTIVNSTAANFRDLTSLIITTNGSAAGNWRLRDATATSTIRAVINTPATAGSIVALQFQPPLKQGLINNNWTLQSNSTSVTGDILAQFVNTQ